MPKSLEAYRSVVGDAVDELRALSEPLRGARVLHLSSTHYGGGVAEILSSLVPLLNNLGINTHWRVLRGGEEFFAVTKAMHNLLQGMPIPWTSAMRDVWLRYTEANARLLKEGYDIVWVHDPQPAGVLWALEEKKGRRGAWIWRCHLDLSDAQQEVWEFLRGYVDRYDAVVFTMREFVRNGLVRPRVFTIPPAIDPLSPKNLPLERQQTRDILTRYTVDTERPLLLQVSRFDPWKDPLGVIDIYRMVKSEVPSVQLVLMANMADDDPEGWMYFERAARKAGDDFDIHFVNGNSRLHVNAFQRSASVVLQMSVREGFGLVVSEALWKRRPVVARGVGGIPMQVTEGETGYLVNSLADAAHRVLELLERPSLGERLGQQGQEHVRRNFLITRYLRDHIQVMQAVSNGSSK